MFELRPGGCFTDTWAELPTLTTTVRTREKAVVPGLSTRTALFAAYSVCLGLASLDVLRALIELSTTDPTSSHLVLIPFITLALIYHRREAIFSTAGFAWHGGLSLIAAGLACLFAALLYHPLGGLRDALTLRVAILVVLWTGGFLFVYGRQAFRAALFPLLFLALMIPIPAMLLAGTIRVLTAGSSEVVAGLFTLTGTPFHREGLVFALPGVSIRIAEECSGIRSTIGVVVAGLLASYMYLTKARSKALFIAALLPMSVLKNGIRIVTLTLLAKHVDHGFLTGRLHHEGGIVFFLFALLLLAPVLALLRRSEESGRARRVTPTLAEQS